LKDPEKQIVGNDWNMTHKNGPTIDKDKKTDINITVKWEEKDKNVIRDRLKVTVDGMESMR
jgi:hypothetical protein